MASSRGSSQPKDRTHVSYVSRIGRRFFTTSATWEAHQRAPQILSSIPFFIGLKFFLEIDAV